MFTFPTGFFFTGQNDPYWDNVVLYIPLTGANGATTFTDVSKYRNTVSRYGNTVISTAQAPPLAGVSSSGYFDGNGDFLLSDPDSNFGTGDYTLEVFSYFLNNTLSQALITMHGNSFSEIAPSLTTSGGQIIYRYGTGTPIITVTAPSNNQWFYLGVTRSSGVTALSINGVQVGSAADTVNLPGYRFRLGGSGSWMFGYMSHLRITKGIARNVSVVPTAPFQIG